MGIFSKLFKWLGFENSKPKDGSPDPKLPTEVMCRNCGKMVSSIDSKDNVNSDIITTCQHCGASWTKTWRDFGIDLDELDGSLGFLKNPNPQYVQFGVEIGDTPTPSIGENIIEILDNSAIKKSGAEIDELISVLEDCAEAEEAYRSMGFFPPPRPYQSAAEEARFHADSNLEADICKRFIELVHFEMLLQKKFKKNGINPKGMPFYIKARERLPIISASQNMKPVALNYVFEQKTPTPSEKKQKLFTQCAEHGISIENYAISYSKARKAFLFDADHYFSSPSKAFLHHLRNQGWSGTDYEFHPVMLLMQAACLNRLEKAARALYGGYIPQPEGKVYYPVNMQVKQSDDGIEISSGSLDLENPYARSFNVQVQMYELDESAVIDDILYTEKLQIKENWHKIYSDSQVRQWFCGLEWQDMEVLLDTIGRKRLAALAQDVFFNPSVNAIGWPDVWAVKDGNLSLFEIKSGDCLRDSQIWTFTTTMRKHGFEGKVVRLKKVSL